ncbi:hypothetical protein [Thermococcus nautili]|uniref:Transglutaminase-like domain-containing protein n=1 Tax=Thermococcus nautili TaxID=195522 RepID=W8NX17_9EURY|nr:hypothetical protein [Thermococcus nautili]AHL23717.1 hypothetical protein BD01_2121 [Thermococcus nautili]CAI1492205.1 conserved protein of unknown function [Thermococcus nautili]
MGLGTGVAKVFAIFLVTFLLLANLVAPPEVKLNSPSGPERFLVVPIKFIQYRLGHGENYSVESPYSPFDFKLGEPRDKVPVWTFNARALLSDVDGEYVENYVDETVETARGWVTHAGYAPTPELLRGTAFMVMWSRGRLYENIGGTHLPSRTISSGGDCDDWTMVRWAIIRRINEEAGIRALYFFVEVTGEVSSHAFLAVYYPSTGDWELYDWFAVRKLFVVLYGSCPHCVARPIKFPDLKTALTAYYLGARGTIYWGDVLAKYGRVNAYLLPTEHDPHVYPLEFETLSGIRYFSPTKSDLERARRIVELAWANVTAGGSGENGTYVVSVLFNGREVSSLRLSPHNGGLWVSLNVEGLSGEVTITAYGGYFSLVNSTEVVLREWEKPGMIGDFLAFGRAGVLLKSPKLTLLVSPKDFLRIVLEDKRGNRLSVFVSRV